MKIKAIKFLSIALMLIFTLGAIFSVSAAKYVAKPVVEQFENSTLFLAPGDIDADGKVNALDYSTLREIILLNKTNDFSDVNGDGKVLITDLVLQDENKGDFISNGKMNLNGKSVYNKELTSALSTGAEYKVTYNASGNVKVKLTGLNGVDITASGYTFKTPLNLSGQNVKLYVTGNGTIEDLSIVRVNMDNDFSVK